MVLYVFIALLQLATGYSPTFIQTSTLQPNLDFAASFYSDSGQVAGGVEILDQGLADAVNQGSADLQLLGQETDAVLEGIGSSLIRMVQSEISEVQDDLDDALERRDELTDALDDLTDVCSGYTGCDSCTYDLDCVWCTAERTCVRGDDTGALGRGCTDFQYAECAVVGCARNYQCAACVAAAGCGWCLDSRECMTGTENDSNSCEPTLWVSGSQSLCPISTSIGSPQSVNTAQERADSNRDEISREADDLDELIDTLRLQIAQLETELEELQQGFLSVTELSPAPQQLQESVYYLGDIVDSTDLSQSKGYVDSQRVSVAQSTAETVGQRDSRVTVRALNSSNEARIAAEDVLISPLQSNIASTSNRNRDQLNELLALIARNEELLQNLTIAVTNSTQSFLQLEPTLLKRN